MKEDILKERLKFIFDFCSINERRLKDTCISFEDDSQLQKVLNEHLFKIYGFVAQTYYDIDSDLVSKSNLEFYRQLFIENFNSFSEVKYYEL